MYTDGVHAWISKNNYGTMIYKFMECIHWYPHCLKFVSVPYVLEWYGFNCYLIYETLIDIVYRFTDFNVVTQTMSPIDYNALSDIDR